MCLRGGDDGRGAAARPLAAGLCALALWVCAAAQSGGQEIAQQPLVATTPHERALERWLEERQLLAPLAWLLEELHARAAQEDREPIARKLAVVYAAQFERAEDDATRSDVEEAAAQLLETATGPAARQLRLTILRARYAAAERLAERWLMALEDESARDSAAETLRAVATALADEALQAERRIASLSRQVEAVSGQQARLAERLVSEEQRRKSLASYLGGWAQTYVALLTGSRPAAKEGLALLDRVLFPSGAPEDDPVRRFDPALLRFEHVARAAVAAALCQAALGEGGTADRWFEILEASEATPASVRQQLPVRRLLALATLRQWSRFTQLLRGRKELSLAQARLAAALPLREAARSRDPAVRRAAQVAVEQLAQRGLIEQALDLAQRLPSDALDEQGFVGLYTKAAQLHQQARQLRAQRPDEARALARQAATLAERALQEAGDSASLRYAALALAASAWSEADRSGQAPVRAARLFEQAAELAPDDAARGEALWGAIMALAQAGDPKRRTALTERFLNAFPNHRRYGAVALEASRLAGADPVLTAQRLLRTPVTDPLVEAARSRAAALLFKAQRSAPSSTRPALIGQYLDVALGLLFVDLRRADDGDVEAARRALARARRILEAATTSAPVDLASARRALEAVESLQGRVDIDAAAQDEIDERRVRTLLASGTIDDAAALAQTLGRRSPGSVWAASATQLVVQAAVERWRAAQGREGDAANELRCAAAQLLLRVAMPLLSDASQELDARLAPVASALAEAAFLLWSEAPDDEALLAQAWRLNEEALAQRPRERGALRRRGVLASVRGDAERALEAWRTLSAALAQTDPGWFEARLGVIEALERLDPQRAREALAQHIAMHPELAPPPLPERFKAAARRLGLHEEAPSASADEAGEGRR